KLHQRGSGMPRNVTRLGRKLKVVVVICAGLAEATGVDAAVSRLKEYQSRWPPRNSGACKTRFWSGTGDPRAKSYSSRDGCQAASCEGSVNREARYDTKSASTCAMPGVPAPGGNGCGGTWPRATARAEL